MSGSNLERLDTVRRAQHAVTQAVQNARPNTSEVAFVFNQENGLRPTIWSHAHANRHGSAFGFQYPRPIHCHGRALAQARTHLDGSACLSDCHEARCEAETGSLPARFGGEERLEEVFQGFAAHTT